MRRRGKRHMALAAKEPRGRVQPDPAGAGKIDLGPGVKVGEIILGARGPSSGSTSGRELNEVAGHEARREARAGEESAPTAMRYRGRSPTQGQRFIRRSARRAPCGSYNRSPALSLR